MPRLVRRSLLCLTSMTAVSPSIDKSSSDRASIDKNDSIEIAASSTSAEKEDLAPSTVTPSTLTDIIFRRKRTDPGAIATEVCDQLPHTALKMT